MKLDVQLGENDLKKLPAEALRLEKMGFDTLWSFEAAHNPFLPLTVAGLAAQKINVGTNIAVAFPRSPFVTAQVAWDVQKATGGRFILGLGTQVRMHNERRFSVASDSPAPRVKDMINCIRAIWNTFQNDAPADYQGRFYQFRLMSPFFNPGPIDHPDIPIFLAGVRPIMCKAAGEVADGLHAHPFHSVKYLKEVVRPAVDEGAKTRGKTVNDLEISAPVFAVLGETDGERTKMELEIRNQIAFYASTPNYRPVMALHGWEETAEKLSKMARAGEWDQMGKLITDEMLDTFALNVPFSKLADTIRNRYQGVLDRTALYFPLPKNAPVEPWAEFAGQVQAS